MHCRPYLLRSDRAVEIKSREAQSVLSKISVGSMGRFEETETGNA